MKRIVRTAWLMLCLLLAGCQAVGEGQIVTTGFPCYDLARQVAGGEMDVRMLIRPGTEVHTFEPSPSDILTLGDADLFVYIGGESDVWADSILSSFGEQAPQAVRLMECVTALEEEHGDHIELDEHIWTSPKNALKMLRGVEAALCQVRPESAEIFHANADRYAREIERLDADLENLIANSARRELVFADRFPFLYLAKDYGIEYHAAFASCASETEPSAQTMVELIEVIRRDGIPAVYTIELSNGAIARALSEETGAQVLQMHSVQTVTQAEFDAGETYVSLMRKNLEAMEKGLN